MRNNYYDICQQNECSNYIHTTHNLSLTNVQTKEQRIGTLELVRRYDPKSYASHHLAIPAKFEINILYGTI